MKIENMTFSEAYETMKQGYEVERKNINWELRKLNRHSLKLNEGGSIVDNENAPIIRLPINDVLATDWGIYTEPKQEPQFEIGELVMMRMRGGIWHPKFYSHKTDNKNSRYRSISDEYLYDECAKFDKDIVFTNKPTKQ